MHALIKVEDMSDEAFASRHLRYEIYEKKQLFPTTGQHRRSRSNRSESDQSTLPHARSPEPTSAIDFSCDLPPAPSSSSSSHGLDSMLHPQESLSPTVATFDGRMRRNSSSSSVVHRTMSFSFDPLAVSRFAEPTNAADVVAATTRSWPPRTFPLDDSDVEQLHDRRSNVTKQHSMLSNRIVVAATTTPASASSSLPSVFAQVPAVASSTSSACDPGWTVMAKPVKQDGGDGAAQTFILKISKV